MIESILAFDRPRLVEALRRIASDDEETVLQSARDASAIIAAAGLTWEDLLVPARPVAEAASGAATEPTDDGARIAALLALPDLSAEARESLAEMARDLAAGEVRDEDRTYLHALYERLIKAG